MAYAPSATVRDAQIDSAQRVDPFGSGRVAEMTRLTGSPSEGNAIAPNVWVTTVATGGAATQAFGITSLTTTATLGSLAQTIGRKRGRYMTGTPNQWIAGTRESDLGVVGNVRRWGVFDADNGMFFERSGTQIGIVIRSGTVDNRITVFNGTNAFVNDTNFHTYEIWWTAGRCFFFQDFKLIHSFNNPLGQLTQRMSVKMGYENRNVAASTASTLFYRGSAILRFGKGNSEPGFARLTAPATTTVKPSPGRLHRIVINNRGGAIGGSVLTIYDSPTATGTIVATIDLQNSQIGSMEFGFDLDEGLTTVISGTFTNGDVTVVHD